MQGLNAFLLHEWYCFGGFCPSIMVYVPSKHINKQLPSSPSRDGHLMQMPMRGWPYNFVPDRSVEGEKSQNCGSLRNKPKNVECYSSSPSSWIIPGNTMAENWTAVTLKWITTVIQKELERAGLDLWMHFCLKYSFLRWCQMSVDK